MNRFGSLKDVASKIKNENKKIILIHAFNSIGKTRLSMEFKRLVNVEKMMKVLIIIFFIIMHLLRIYFHGIIAKGR